MLFHGMVSPGFSGKICRLKIRRSSLILSSAEVFPTGVRAVCTLFTTCTQWLGQFMIAYSTPYMMNNITYGTFLFFGSSVIVGVILVFFSLPETKEVALEDMDIMFGVKGLAWHKRKETDRILAERRAELRDEQDTIRIKQTVISHVEKSDSSV